MYNDKDLRFQQFDYGTRCNNTRPFHESCNQQKYGSTVPPEYNLGAITAPQVWYACGHWHVLPGPGIRTAAAAGTIGAGRALGVTVDNEYGVRDVSLWFHSHDPSAARVLPSAL